jgi:hypothetical protein
MNFLGRLPGSKPLNYENVAAIIAGIFVWPLI